MRVRAARLATFVSALTFLGACTVEDVGPRTPDGDGSLPDAGSVGYDAAWRAMMDMDGDGFTPADGDCEDEVRQINPAAYDDPSNGLDEDCHSGPAGGDGFACDLGLQIASTAPEDGARAIGLCQFATETERKWGVISARYTKADGSGAPAANEQFGILPALGVVAPLQGSALLGLSSGVARAPGQPSYTLACDAMSDASSSPPAGLNVTSSCGTSGAVHDPVALELRIRVPSNAEGFSFASRFYTYEFPDYICNAFNDFFVVMVDPIPAGSTDGNVVFDQMNNKVSVNNAFLTECQAGTYSPIFGTPRTYACPNGRAEMAGTGFDGTDMGTFPVEVACGQTFGHRTEIGAGTGWLRTTVAIAPGSIITIRFAIWDAGDADLDSLSLIDDFTWLLEDPGDVDTVPIM